MVESGIEDQLPIKYGVAGGIECDDRWLRRSGAEEPTKYITSLIKPAMNDLIICHHGALPEAQSRKPIILPGALRAVEMSRTY